VSGAKIASTAFRVMFPATADAAMRVPEQAGTRKGKEETRRQAQERKAMATEEQGTTGQNRTKQTRAQKQAKQTKTNKALFTEQAADFGMWQQSRAAYAGRRQIHAIMESTSR
jgi:hypothetical protein